MKKTVLALGLLLTTTLAAWSQSNSDGTGFRFGFHASPTWSWMTTDETLIEGAGSNWGIKVGAIGEIFFTPNYAIVTGLGFSFNQGGTLQNSYERSAAWVESGLQTADVNGSVSREAKYHYRINYVEIPLGLKMRGGSNEDSPIKFYAEVPVFTLGFRTKATGDIRGTNIEDSINDDVNALALSWGLGGGIEYELSASSRLVAGLAFQKEFLDVTGDKGKVLTGADWTDEKSKATIGLMSLRIGVFF
jgi:hypothetical protein